VLLPTVMIAQQSQQRPQPRQPGQWCPIGWVASGSYCVRGPPRRPPLSRRTVGVRPAGARAAVIASAEGPQPFALRTCCASRPHCRHGRACPGHPRLWRTKKSKTWMPGSADKFTQSAQAWLRAGHDGERGRAPHL